MDPRLIGSAADLAERYGDDAIVIARQLAWTIREPEHRAFWGGVAMVLLSGGGMSARAAEA